MIVIGFKITESRPQDIPRDAWRHILRTAHRIVGEHWHHDILPDHFTAKARYRYRHKLRTRKYQREKERAGTSGRPYRKGMGAVVMGGQVDNVLTGYMMDQLKSAKAIRAFPTRVTVRMFGPRYITMRPYQSNQPDKAKEIVTTTEEQKKTLARLFEQSIVDQLNAYRAPRTTNI